MAVKLVDPTDETKVYFAICKHEEFDDKPRQGTIDQSHVIMIKAASVVKVFTEADYRETSSIDELMKRTPVAEGLAECSTKEPMGPGPQRRRRGWRIALGRSVKILGFKLVARKGYLLRKR